MSILYDERKISEEVKKYIMDNREDISDSLANDERLVAMKTE